MKKKGPPDFRPIISRTFFTILNLIEFGNTEIYFVLVSNYLFCFLFFAVKFVS